MLSVDDIHTYYGDSYVLQGVSLDVPLGAVTALLGRNGMGKTTLIRSVVGFARPRRGRVMFGGRDITRAPSHEIARLGIGLVPQGRRIFPSLTVHENLTVAARDANGAAGAAAAWPIERVLELFPRLGERAGHRGNMLSGGEQQMLAIGRALMSKPKLLMLDEPSLGLAPILVDTIFQIVREINAEGIPILLVEQNAHKALEVAHRAYVLETGSIVKAGSGKELLDSPDVQRAYLGI